MGSFIDDGIKVASFGTINTDIGGRGATNNAINAQTTAANQANETQKYIFDTNRADNQPWRQAGVQALAGLQDPNFGKNLEMDPGYQFRLAEGEKAIANAASARGINNSGSTLKALTKYGQDYASNEYGKVYDRLYQRTAGLAGVGQQATAQDANTATNYGNNVAANQVGLGNAIASANIGTANRNSQLLGQGAGAAALAFCDQRLKTDITPVNFLDIEIEEMSKHLKAYSFNYVSPEFGEGNWIGVMAQDLEKSRLGKTLVVTDENGHKQVDMKKVMSLFLATLAKG